MHTIKKLLLGEHSSTSAELAKNAVDFPNSRAARLTLKTVLCTRGLMDEMPDASQRRALCYKIAVEFRVQGHDALV